MNQGSEVKLWIIGLTSFPAAKQNTNPFIGQCAHGSMMAFTSGTLLLIEGGGPITETHRVASKFVEGLAEEFGAGPAEVNPRAFAASFGYRSNPKSS